MTGVWITQKLITHNSKLNEVNRIGLKVNGIWCVLPQDVSISIEEQNPLFSDSGSFSYPIELSISQNRELFKSIDSPQGRIRPQDLDGLPFELWFDGVMLLYGSTETDEDLDIDEDKCSINLVSGNGDFQSKIDGMQCTDVPLLDDLYIGNSYSSAIFTYKIKVTHEHPNNGTSTTEIYEKTKELFLDEPNSVEFLAPNVSDPYPVKPYCNVRVCVKRSDEYDKSKESPYLVLEAQRPNSGLCFYVGYFLKSLFKYLGLVVTESHFQDVEDMNRLAFFTTKCKCEVREKEELELDSLEYKNGDISFKVRVPYDAKQIVSTSLKLNRSKLYATSENFPSTDVSTVVESLFNAFGLKIVNDPLKNDVSLYFMRDILRDPEIIDCKMGVISKTIQYSKVKGVRLSYGGDEEDTAFVYKDFTKDNVRLFTEYKEVINNVQANDKSCYISQVTGNKYRIKIDKDAEEEGDEKNLNPALFEVAQFNDFVVGEDSEDAEELKIGFTPLIENDVLSKSLMADESHKQQTLAVYIDGVELKKAGTEVQKIDSVYVPPRDSTNQTSGTYQSITLTQYRSINYDRSTGNEDPLQEHDSGFTLGVMRGAGANSSYTVTVENYDGNGNSAWVTVADDYAFTADSVDAYGNRYDYNGNIEGGVVGLEDTISLKTHIQTAQELGLKDKDGNPIDWGIDSQAAKRGLADRFMSEYMHFLLNRKTVSMDVDTTLSQLTSLSWFKQLRISDVVGRLKSRSYTLTNSGVSDMNIELYTIN